MADDFLSDMMKLEDTSIKQSVEEGDSKTSSKSKEEYVLSDREKGDVVKAWKEGIDDLKKIIEAACGAGYDGRSHQGLAVKRFLAEMNMEARPAQVFKKRVAPVLTEENREFIANNATEMKPLEMVRIIFRNPSISPLNAEFKLVKEYYDSLDNKLKAQTPDEDVKEYTPPKTEINAIARVNKYAYQAYDPEKLTPRHKEALVRMIKYMHTHRFLSEIRNLQKNSERVLFESSFVRFIYDKPDLTEEEIDLYLNQCSDVVSYQRMREEDSALCQARDEEMATNNKIPMALVEAIGKLRSDMDANFKRQKSNLNDLNGRRRDRLDKIGSNNESVLKLIEAFRDEQQRGRILKIMQKRKEDVKNEVERLETLEDLKFSLFGATREELL
jgi:hypothetical protein